MTPLADTIGRLLLPTPANAALLQSALLDGEGARRAWARFMALAPEPRTFFECDRAGVKRHLPLLHDNLVRHGIDIDRVVQPILRTAVVREELRAARFRRAMHAGLAALHDAGVSVVLLKGAALGETVYEAPTLRHSHDVDVWVDDRELTRAVAALMKAGFTRHAAALHDGGVRMDHPSGLPIELHGRLFDAPFCHAMEGAMIERARPTRVMGVPVRVLEPSDAVAHVVGHALFNPRRGSCAWIVDAALLADRPREVDWQRVAEVLMHSRLVVSTAVQMRALAEMFKVPVDSAALATLDQAAREADRCEVALVVDMLHRRPSRRVMELLEAGGVRSGARVLALLAVPPAAYLRQREDVTGSLSLLGCYVRRAGRFGGRQIRKGVYRARRALRLAPMPSRTMEQPQP